MPRRIWENRTALIFFLALILWATSEQNSFSLEEVHFIREINTNLSCPIDVAVMDSGEIYVLDFLKARVSVFDPNGNFKQNFDDPQDESARLRGPRSLAVSPRGRVAVADTGNNRIRVFDKNGTFIFEFGAGGDLPGQFRSPSGITMDQFGFMFVADKDNQRIQVFSPNGIFLNEFSTESRPVDLGIDPQRNLYVLMPDIAKIVKYDSSGKKLQDISCQIERRNYLSRAKGLTVDTRGDIYITESQENSVKKFDDTQTLLISFGSGGEGRGQFRGAEGMVCDSQGQIYIVDSQNKRVQIFKVTGSLKNVLPSVENSPLVLDLDSTIEAENGIIDLFSLPGKGLYMLSDQLGQIIVRGREKGVFGRNGSQSGEFLTPQGLQVTLDGQMFVADTGMDRIQILNSEGAATYCFGKAGDKASQFHQPEGVAVNDRGDIYIADTGNRRVEIFNYDGIYLKSFGMRRESVKKNTDAELLYPKAIAIDSRNHVYVIDKERCLIQIFSSDGQYWGSIGEKGNKFGQFEAPVDIAIDENNMIYVADRGNHRVQIFDSQGKFVLAFGSPGKGGGYFQEMSALTVSEGMIYVADYATNYIQVFHYAPDGLGKGNRIYATRVAPPPAEDGENSVARYHKAKMSARQEAIDELVKTTGASRDQITTLMKIESIASLNNGEVKVTVSVPQELARAQANALQKSTTFGQKP